MDRSSLYPVAFDRQDRFGRCIGVWLARAQTYDPSVLAQLLHPRERTICRSMKGARRVEWIGGRIASQMAREDTPDAGRPVLVNAIGGPETGGRVQLSISHTRRLAVALVGASGLHSVGVDIEQPAIGIFEEQLLVEKIVSTREQRSNSGWRYIPPVQLLSIKEAVFKAVCALTGKPVALRDIHVRRTKNGKGRFQIAPFANGVKAEVDSRPVNGHILSIARAQV